MVLPATALMVTATLVLPHDAVPGPEELPSRASETECVHTGPVRGIADLASVLGSVDSETLVVRGADPEFTEEVDEARLRFAADGRE